MKIIGLTGGIASGKSTVSKVLKDLGATIIDMDLIAREIVKPGLPAWQEIVQFFGNEILRQDGEINRPALAAQVFGNEAARRRLNEITHPRLIKETQKRLEEIRHRENAVAVIDAPLLIEAGMTDLVDEVWLVAIPQELQVLRLMERDGISQAEAKKRIDSQMPLEEKKKFAHYIIDTKGSMQDTVKQVLDLWENQIGKYEKDILQ